AEAEAVLAQARAAGQRIAGAWSLWGLPELPDLPGRAADARDSLHHAPVALAAALAPTAEAPVRLLLATAGAHNVLGEGVSEVAGALAVGPVLALPLELPGLRARQIDLDATQLGDTEALAQALLEEAGARDEEDFVALRQGQRWWRRVERAAVPAATAEELPLSEGAVVWITGGLGGMGLAI